MYELYHDKSAVDGHPLPWRWIDMDDTQKRVVVNFLNADRPFREFPTPWKLVTPVDRDAVVRHLAKLGMIPQYIERRKAVDLQLLSDMQRAAERRSQDWQGHPSPNGGNRILPSKYAQLDDQWVTNRGEWKRPTQMSVGHLENVLNLLKESNGNCVALCTSKLGQMRKHFRNSSEVCDLLDKLCTAMQNVDVDEQYPVFRRIARSFSIRRALQQYEDQLIENYGDDCDDRI